MLYLWSMTPNSGEDLILKIESLFQKYKLHSLLGYKSTQQLISAEYPGPVLELHVCAGQPERESSSTWGSVTGGCTFKGALWPPSSGRSSWGCQMPPRASVPPDPGASRRVHLPEGRRARHGRHCGGGEGGLLTVLVLILKRTCRCKFQDNDK